jgi:ACS family sodium-dependent inorganic phosphate cotransporter
MAGGIKAEEPPVRPRPSRRWQHRFTIVGMLFAGTALCYLDRISISVAIIPLAAQFHYDAAVQGIVLSAFFWGYIWPQLAGGWMADRFGGYRVLAVGVGLWSLATLVTPPAAASSLMALIAARVVLGMGEGVNFPSVHSLASRWTMPGERARALSLIFSGMHFGTIIALIASPAIIDALGWPALFYLSAGLGVIWLLFWTRYAASDPESSNVIGEEERRLVLLARSAAARANRVPWRAIARERAVWAIIVAHFCTNTGFNILLLWMPTYLHHTFAVPLEWVGGYALIPWIATFAAANGGGWIADRMRARGIGTTTVRKAMQTACFAFGGLALLVLPLASTPSIAVLILTVAAGATGLSFSAVGVNHLDVGPTYAGILMGISNTVATLPGIVGVAAAGFIVRATGSFTAVFDLIAIIYAAGLLLYLAWASGEQKL